MDASRHKARNKTKLLRNPFINEWHLALTSGGLEARRKGFAVPISGGGHFQFQHDLS